MAKWYVVYFFTAKLLSAGQKSNILNACFSAVRQLVRLTTYTDYGFRLLMFVAMKKGALCTIQEAADAYAISKNHLMKVAYELGRHGLLETVRGRKGGLRLAKRPDQIRLGDVVRLMEDDLAMVECFTPKTNTCPISPICGLRSVLGEALDAYLEVLDRYTLADLVNRPAAFLRLLKTG